MLAIEIFILYNALIAKKQIKLT